MKIWHDDIREPPEPGWTWVQTNKQAIHLLLEAEMRGVKVTEMSLDHDLGAEGSDIYTAGASPDGDGVDLVQAMCALRLVPPKITVHSWNPEGAARMVGMLEGMSDAKVIRRAYEPPDLSEDGRWAMKAMGLLADPRAACSCEETRGDNRYCPACY